MEFTYSVIGLGKLGASMAAAIASRGFDVIGVDVNQQVADALNTGRAPVREKGLDELIAANRARLRATRSHREAVLGSDVTFVVVPTPSDERGAFSLQYAAWAFREIGRGLKEKGRYHNVVLTSTVLPGATRFGLMPILERESGKICGRDFGLCYSPTFVALGSVIRDFLSPDFALIGEIDERAGSQLEDCYARIMEDSPPCRRMSIENAELAKIALNTYVTVKITFANMLALLCERIPGGDVDVVTETIGLDRRIGSKYLKGGLGYGGPCFPRDSIALTFLGRALGIQTHLSEATDLMNRGLIARAVDSLRPLMRHGATVAVLGLAYKPLSHVTDESQGILLCKALSEAGVRVVAYDPLAEDAARVELHGHAVVLSSLADCLKQADVIVVATPDPAFGALTADDFIRNSAPVTVVDFWRILQAKLSGKGNIRYVGGGLSEDDGRNGEQLAALWGDVPRSPFGR